MPAYRVLAKISQPQAEQLLLAAKEVLKHFYSSKIMAIVRPTGSKLDMKRQAFVHLAEIVLEIEKL